VKFGVGKKKRLKIFCHLLKRASDWFDASQVSTKVSPFTRPMSRDLRGPVSPNKMIGTTHAVKLNIEGRATIGIHAKK
jgi:hypothetical protein